MKPFEVPYVLMALVLGVSANVVAENQSSFDLQDLPAFSCSWANGPIVQWSPETRSLSYLGGPKADFGDVIGDARAKPQGSSGIYLDIQSYDMRPQAHDARYVGGRIWLASSDTLFMGWQERGMPRGHWVATVLTELKGAPGVEDSRFWDMVSCRFERPL